MQGPVNCHIVVPKAGEEKRERKRPSATEIACRLMPLPDVNTIREKMGHG